MKPDFSYYSERVLNILKEENLTLEDKENYIKEIFIDIELEFGYIDQKREEAEDSLKILFEAIKEKNEKEIEQSENYLSPDV